VSSLASLAAGTTHGKNMGEKGWTSLRSVQWTGRPTGSSGPLGHPDAYPSVLVMHWPSCGGARCRSLRRVTKLCEGWVNEQLRVSESGGEVSGVVLADERARHVSRFLRRHYPNERSEW